MKRNILNLDPVIQALMLQDLRLMFLLFDQNEFFSSRNFSNSD